MQSKRRAFTLVEMLIVVALMAIVAGAVIAQVDASDREAKRATLEHNEHLLNTLIAAYKVDHGGRTPNVISGGLPQLFSATNASGAVGPSGTAFPHGPYLATGEMPINPRTDSRDVTPVLQFPPAAYTGGGWLYHKATGQIMADRRPGGAVAVDGIDGAVDSGTPALFKK